MSDPSEFVLPLDGRWKQEGLTMEWFIEKAAWLGRDSHTYAGADFFFDAAGRLLKYCAVDYELLGPMCFHAIIGLEARLRFFFKAGPKDPFKELFRRAVEEKLVTDEVFSNPQPLPKNFLKMIGKPHPSTHVERLALLLPTIRNGYFHGSYLLAPELLHLAIEVRELSDALTEA